MKGRCIVNDKSYQIVNGTFYCTQTSRAVIDILEDSRVSGKRLIILLGDSTTGAAWGDIDEGRIGRSLGPIKVPLLIANSLSTGGPSLLDACIIKILAARGKEVLYQHRNFHAPAGVEFYGKNAKYANS